MSRNYYPICWIKKHYLIIKSKIFNFKHVYEMKIRMGYITNIFLWL